MKDVFYQLLNIPLKITNPMKLVDVSGVPGVYNERMLKLFGVDGSDGVFIFQSGQSFEHGLNNKYQVMETPSGLLQVSESGVITLNGDNELNQISAAINDQIIADYEKLKIFYNERHKHLYVFCDSYLLRVKYSNGYWEKFYGNFDWECMKEDFDGETVYSKDNKIYKLTPSGASEAYMKFQTTTLGEQSLYYVVLRIYLDMEIPISERVKPGAIFLECQGYKYRVPIPDAGPARESFEVVIPLIGQDGLPKRVGKEDIEMKLIVDIFNIKFYNMEVEYDVIAKN